MITEELRKQVEQYRVKEMKTVQALRSSIAPVWTDAYGSIYEQDKSGVTFETFIATVLDTLPIFDTRSNEA